MCDAGSKVSTPTLVKLSIEDTNGTQQSVLYTYIERCMSHVPFPDEDEFEGNSVAGTAGSILTEPYSRCVLYRDMRYHCHTQSWRNYMRYLVQTSQWKLVWHPITGCLRNKSHTSQCNSCWSHTATSWHDHVTTSTHFSIRAPCVVL